MNGTHITRPGTFTTVYDSRRVAGKIEVVVDTVPYTPTDEALQEQLPPETPHCLAWSKLPAVAVGIIGGQLTTAGALAQTNNFNHLAIQQMHRSRLKPKYRAENPSISYADPTKRLDQFVPSDKTGREYLKSLGITQRYLINQIKKGGSEGMSIEQAQKTVQNNLQNIQFARQSSRHLAHALSFAQIHYYVECGLISLERLAEVGKAEEGDAIRLTILGEPALKQYVDTGELLIQDILEMNLGVWGAFQIPAVRKYLKDNKFSMKDVLTLSFIADQRLKIPLLQKYFEQGRLSKSEFINISGSAAETFSRPVVEHCLESCDPSLKQSLINQILTISDWTEWTLHSPSIEQCLATGQVSLKQVLDITPEAVAVLDHLKFRFDPEVEVLDIEKILKYDGSTKPIYLYNLNAEDFIKPKAAGSVALI